MGKRFFAMSSGAFRARDRRAGCRRSRLRLRLPATCGLPDSRSPVGARFDSPIAQLDLRSAASRPCPVTNAIQPAGKIQQQSAGTVVHPMAGLLSDGEGRPAHVRRERGGPIPAKSSASAACAPVAVEYGCATQNLRKFHRRFVEDLIGKGPWRKSLLAGAWLDGEETCRCSPCGRTDFLVL